MTKGRMTNGITVIYKDGSLFEGVFRFNDTVKGRYITTKGYVYEGEMKNHKMHGDGILKYHGKTLYEGEFIKGVPAEECLELKSTPSDNETEVESEKLSTRKSVHFTLN